MKPLTSQRVSRKICFVLPTHWSYQIGGAELQVQYITDYLAEHRPDYQLWYLCRYARTSPGSRVNIITLTHQSKKIPFVLDFWEMNCILNRIKPDVIYQRVGCAYTGFVAWYGRRNRCKTIWHVASQRDITPVPETVSPPKRVINAIDRVILNYGIRHADHIIGQARYQNRILASRFGRSCDIILPNVHPVPEVIPPKRDPIQVVWIGRIEGPKQPELFLRLARHFTAQSGIKFIMIGNAGTYWQPRLAQHMVEHPHFEYKGVLAVDEVNRILETAHILVNTSTFEGFPNTFIQAWLRGVPVVSLHVNPDGLLTSQKIGFYAQTYDQLIQDVRCLVADPRRREEMGQRARQFAQNTFSVSHVDRLIELMEQT
ncbi:MAG: glycosyltransferase [Gemmatimonadetes bacterium]|nr:MAG: glycosyltransferase [Gemmatimonadota bacterium]